MDWEWLRELAERHQHKVLGALGGLILALLFVRFGWWTLFILFCTGIGYWIGKRLDEQPGSLTDVLERLFPPGGRFMR